MFKMTKHGSERCAQRGLDPNLLEVAAEIGDYVDGRGYLIRARDVCDEISALTQELKLAKRKGLDQMVLNDRLAALKKIKGVVRIVVSNDNHLITAYRANRRDERAFLRSRCKQ
ncbi:hypothetical protein [Aquidulcibacter paucihalophilus]|uniref:hypothetical protein n=1 Tax=Aquidulcibacter paucihalophilus TaxID=1978549 RepID=UPI000A19A6AD|nr:hypothetical protein [Aquidulcibacter paucihalophilus]